MKPSSPGQRWLFAFAGLLVLLIGGVFACEAAGWPFLVGPVQRKLAEVLNRPIRLGNDNHDRSVRIGLLGNVRVQAARIEIGAPSWSSTPYTFRAQDAALTLTYSDLLRIYRGGALRIEDLQAQVFDTQLERLADGRASWQFEREAQNAAPAKTAELPTFGRLQVRAGSLSIRDAITPADVDARYSLSDGTRAPGATAIKSAAGGATSQPDRRASLSESDSGSAASPGLKLSATGHYKSRDLKIEVATDGVLILEGKTAQAQPLRMDATIGTAHMIFEGTVTDPLHFTGLRGRFSLFGPSLAAAGDPLGITLPTTPRFNAVGVLVKDGDTWKALINRADIGSSHLRGAFVFAKQGEVPTLSGRVQGTRLLLADLAPAIGKASQPSAPKAEPQALPAKVIPDRRFDLPSLRAMNANVLIDIDDLDLGTTLLEPLRPLRTHLTLAGGVLSFNDLDARTGQGEIQGRISLDGREEQALWTADVRLANIRMEQWLHQKRSPGDPPYVTGKLVGKAKVQGSGRSTAEILGSLTGGVQFHLTDATLSHLALKAAGLDVAGGVKVLLSGDEPLHLRCNVADLAIAHGVVRPKVLVLSLDNATVWIDGDVSLRSEQLNLRAVSAPKDLSPFTLRTPIDVKGTFSKPAISIEKGPLAGKLGAAALLALLNPLAGLIPFIDPGSREAAKKADIGCLALVKRGTSTQVSSKLIVTWQALLP